MQNWVKWFVALAEDFFRIQRDPDMFSASVVKWSTLYLKVPAFFSIFNLKDTKIIALLKFNLLDFQLMKLGK